MGKSSNGDTVSTTESTNSNEKTEEESNKDLLRVRKFLEKFISKHGTWQDLMAKTSSKNSSEKKSLKSDENSNLDLGNEVNEINVFENKESNEVELAPNEQFIEIQEQQTKKDRRCHPLKDDRDKWFEEHKEEIYDLPRRCQSWEKSEKILFNVYKQFKFNSVQAMYMSAYRYGCSKNYIDIKEPEYKEEDTQDAESLELAYGQSVEQPMKNGVWELDIENVEEFHQSESAGLRAYLRSILWSLYKYPCNFHFNREKTKAGELQWDGICKECKSEFQIETMNDRKVLRVTVSNFNGKIKHSNKHSYITGILKSTLLDKLKSTSAVVVQSELARNLMDNLDDSCPIVPSVKNMAQIKYRMQKKERDERHENPIFGDL